MAYVNRTKLQRGHTISSQITLANAPPNVNLPSGWTGGKTNVTGFFIDVIKILANTLNFEYDYVPSKDGYWGSQEADGSWNGMVGMVNRGQADLIGTALSYTKERS